MALEREVMRLAEAAEFLRFSISTMHQRRDIPRHRVPGSREYRYLKNELLAWLKGEQTQEKANELELSSVQRSLPPVVQSVVDISAQRVYHRNTRYR